MAGKLVGFRIPEALGPTLELAAKRAGIRESRYAARLLVKHLRRLERRQAAQACLASIAEAVEKETVDAVS